MKRKREQYPVKRVSRREGGRERKREREKGDAPGERGRLEREKRQRCC